MVLAIIFILLWILELIYIRISDKLNITNSPELRSSHNSQTPTGGGFIFLIGVWIYAVFYGFVYPWFFFGLTLIGLISFIDDIHPLSNRLRLVVQYISISMMFYQFGILDIQNLLIVLVVMTVCVGIVNAYNFMDGINGITGAYSIAVLLPLIYLNAIYSFVDQMLLFIVGLSLLVFCFFNFRSKAICFAGDVGSISIAFILLFAIGRLILDTGDFSYIAFLAVYGVDTVLTICHRIILHENLGKAHRKHAYQLMANELEIPHIFVAILYMAVQSVVSAGLLFLPINHYLYLGIVIAFLSVAYILFMRKYFYLHDINRSR